MSATIRIKRFLVQQRADEIFSTAQLLAFGSRGSIDQAMSRLVKAGIVHRVAPGLFIKSGVAALQVTARQAAEHKAARFGHTIVEHANDTAHKHGLAIMPQYNHTPIFASSGSSSSFLFQGTRIHLKQTSARKMQLSQSDLGEVIRSIWQIGKQSSDAEVMETVHQLMGRSHRQNLPVLASSMPTWLHDQFRWRPAAVRQK